MCAPFLAGAPQECIKSLLTVPIRRLVPGFLAAAPEGSRGLSGLILFGWAMFLVCLSGCVGPVGEGDCKGADGSGWLRVINKASI